MRNVSVLMLALAFCLITHEAKAQAVKPEQPKFTPLDISEAATVASTRIFNQESLVFPQWGKQTHHGIPFKVIDPESGKVKNAICLYSQLGAVSANMPRAVRVACDSPAREIHVLGAAGWGVPWFQAKNTLSMVMRVEYADGDKEDHQVINGVHLTDWAKGPDVPGSKNIGVSQIRYFSIVPKRQDAVIRAIELRKGTDKTSPVVLALTLEPPVAQVAQKPKEEPGKVENDKALLQGRWYAVYEEFGGMAFSKDEIVKLAKILDVTGDDFRIERPVSILAGQISLDQSDTPKKFDFSGKVSNSAYKMYGIYEVSQNTLKLCYTSDKPSTRPLEFRTTPGSGSRYVVFKRQANKVEVAQKPKEEPGKKDAPKEITADLTQKGIAELIADLKDDRHSVRHHAAYTLSRIKPLAKETLPALLDALKKEDSTQSTPIQMYAATAIGNIGPAAKDALDALTDTLTNGKTYDLRIRSLFALQSIGQAGITGMVKGLLPQDKRTEFGSITQMTATCLAECESLAKDALPQLEDCLSKTTDKETRDILTAAIRRIRSGTPMPFKEPPSNRSESTETKAPAPKLLRTFKSHNTGPSTQLLFSPNGTILVSLHRSSEVAGEVMIWDVQSGKKVLAFNYPNRLLHLSFTPDGKTLLWASQSSNNRLEVKALDIDTKKEAKDRAVEFEQPFHRQENNVSFSSDAKYIAWWCGHNASVWEIGTGKQVINTSFTLPIRVAAFSENATLLALQTQSGHLSEQFLVDLTANKPIPFHWRYENVGYYYRRAKEQVEGHSGEASFLGFLEAGNALLSISPGGKEVKLWDLKAKRMKTSFAFSFGSASHGLWIPPSGEYLYARYLIGSTKDGMTVAMGRWLSDDKTTTGVVTIWDAAAWKERTTLTANKGGIYALAISPDGHLLATAGATLGRPRHGEIMVWQVESPTK